MNELALFAGAGGGILGGHLLGWRTVCAVEWDAYAASVLVQRQVDRCLPPFPVWDDVQTFDGRPWRGRVDVISGGFPCQDISCAGAGAGIDGERSSMWKHMARIIDEVRPREGVFIENSPMLAVGRGLGTVLSSLAEMGYDARWGVVGAHHVAAPHKRERIWIVAHSEIIRLKRGVGQQSSEDSSRRELAQFPAPGSCSINGGWWKTDPAEMADASMPYDEGDGRGPKQVQPRGEGGTDEDRQTESQLGRVAHGVANRVDRLKCLGNGQVPQCAALAWRILNEWT